MSDSPDMEGAVVVCVDDIGARGRVVAGRLYRVRSASSWGFVLDDYNTGAAAGEHARSRFLTHHGNMTESEHGCVVTVPLAALFVNLVAAQRRCGAQPEHARRNAVQAIGRLVGGS